MRRFRFSLERVLGLRRREEERVRNELRAVLHALRALEDERDGMEMRKSACEEGLLQERARPIMDVPLILLLQEEGERLTAALARVEERIARARAEADRVRERFREARMRREQLERLKERHRLRHEAAVRAEEMKEINEVAVARFLRGKACGAAASERSDEA